jgi:hypothetical protein
MTAFSVVWATAPAEPATDEPAKAAAAIAAILQVNVILTSALRAPRALF